MERKLTSAEKMALQTWKDLCKDIQSKSTVHTHKESATERAARLKKLRGNYSAFVDYYFPHYTHGVPVAPFHTQAAKMIATDPNLRAEFRWARGHAKSTNMDIFIPMWLKIQNPRKINYMVVVGKSADSSMRLLGNLQAEFESNKRYIADWGEQYNAGFWLDGEFTTQDGCKFVSLGRGQTPRGLNERGQRPDYIVIDDLDDDELCRNEKRVSELFDWVRGALYGTLGAQGGRMIMVGNLIAKTSVLALWSKIEGVKTTQVNIYDRTGKPSWAAYWTPERIAEAERTMGYRAFQREYMNNPITEGAIFQQNQIRWTKILPLKEYRQIICYTDPSFKNSATADYKATMLVGLTKAGHMHLLRAYAGQTSVSEMVEWHYEIMAWVGGKAPVMYYMEANFMQDLMLDEFRKEGNERGYHVPIVGDKRAKGDKFARIEAMQPLFERGLVEFNEAERESKGMQVLVEQLLSFERGSRTHDDAPDALESAIWMLSRRNRTVKANYCFGSRSDRRY